MTRKTYRKQRCPCGDPVCASWHVSPDLDVQGVSMTEDQADVVASVLNNMERFRERLEMLAQQEEPEDG